MSCQTCKSDRILSFSGKVSDLFGCDINGKSHNGYVPEDLNLGGRDYLKGNLCLNCGQLQGKFPLEEVSVERDEPTEDDF